MVGVRLVVTMTLTAQVHKVEFDRGTNARDLQEQLAVVAVEAMLMRCFLDTRAKINLHEARF